MRIMALKRLLTGEEAGTKGADDRSAFMLEARRGYYFTEGLDGTFIDTITAEDVKAKRYTMASHGYSPEKENYTTVFMATGKGIREKCCNPGHASCR